MRRFLEGLFWGLLFIVIASFVEDHLAFFTVLTALLFIIVYIFPFFKKTFYWRFSGYLVFKKL